MNSLLQRVQEAIRRHRVFRPGQRILVAVSGGVDSMVLLQALHQLSKANHWRLTVAHLTHQLRGRSSAADERLVRRTAQRLGLSVVVDRSDVRAFGRENKLSVEMAAREIRHAFLARTARRLRIPVVALAHHADDQIELFFLRLLLGCRACSTPAAVWHCVCNLPPSSRLAIGSHRPRTSATRSRPFSLAPLAPPTPERRAAATTTSPVDGTATR